MEAHFRTIDFRKLIASLLITASIGWLSTLSITPNSIEWYNQLTKPAFWPPEWIFTPVRLITYVLTASSLYLVWTNASYTHAKLNAYAAFAGLIILDATWTLIFLGLGASEAAIAIVISLLIATSVTMWLFWHISKFATYLLVPYIIWVICIAFFNMWVTTS